MTVNPIIRRELISVLRSRWALGMQLGPIAIFSLLVILRWPSEGQVDVAGRQAQQVFRLFGYGLLAMLLLLAPAYPAVSIVAEKKRGTLALLLNTPLSRPSIYLGKLLGALGYIALPLAMSVPAVAACYAMGGLSLTRDIGVLYLVLALVTVQYTALALWISSFATSTDSALRITYGTVLLLAVGTLGPYLFLQGHPDTRAAHVAGWIRCISPIPAVMELVGQGDVGGHGLIADAGAPLRYGVLALATTIALAVHTTWRLTPTLFDRARPAGNNTLGASKSRQWLRRIAFVVDPERRTKPMGRFTNPVLVKEFRTRRFGRSQWMLRLVAVCALASLGLTYAATTGTLSWGVETIGGIMVLLQVALIVMLTPSLAAGLISSERESGGWALLQMTPLSTGRILRGKLLSVGATMLLILLATLPGYAIMMVIKPVLQQQVLLVLACLLLTAMFAVCLSAAVSSLFRHTAPATIASYALLIALCGGPLLLWLGRDAPFGHDLVQAALRIDPIAAALSILEVSNFSQYNVLPANWWIIASATAFSLALLTFRTWRLTQPR